MAVNIKINFIIGYSVEGGPADFRKIFFVWHGTCAVVFHVFLKKIEAKGTT
jgi:hypothetical protein